MGLAVVVEPVSNYEVKRRQRHFANSIGYETAFFQVNEIDPCGDIFS
jgi:hypothetical protein